jgi:hypothetical protein
LLLVFPDSGPADDDDDDDDGDPVAVPYSYYKK